ncbi:EexN family lipoprotein [Shewanella intestini]|uniref:EexN family lipoprotein n=1 Tax=Shewanella intestini TaxID=2017544 RepID=A0ABS5I326_9GAMM|nr:MULTISPECIES: EexN family lipoprotein [Shewanella]MBR9728437.1 EexN family lipoprotein [Shewanella intestini]
MKTLSLILSLLMMTMACTKQEVKSVAYFKANIAEAKVKVQWCKISTERSITSNCINASSALAHIKSQQLLGNHAVTSAGVTQATQQP